MASQIMLIFATFASFFGILSTTGTELVVLAPSVFGAKQINHVGLNHPSPLTSVRESSGHGARFITLSFGRLRRQRPLRKF
jgi:hypothetical protein